jgi:hypothetical protein
VGSIVRPKLSEEQPLCNQASSKDQHASGRKHALRHETWKLGTPEFEECVDNPEVGERPTTKPNPRYAL